LKGDKKVMQTKLQGRDLICDLDFSLEEAETALDVAFELKRMRALGLPHAYLRDKTLALLFFFSSTRTRNSCEAGMAQLGGHAAYIDSHTTQISHGDTEKEIGEILGRYFDGIAIRQCDWGIGNHYMKEVAKASRVPVLSLQCEWFHPIQTLADLMTMQEKKGRNLRGKKIVITWAYASSYQKPMSVPLSMILQLPRFGMDVVVAHPPEFKLVPEIVDEAHQLAKKYNTCLDFTDDMEAGFRGADIVYAKSWAPLVTTIDPGESAKIIQKYESWIVDKSKMTLAKPDAIFMHPLPADRNVEVTDEVIDSAQSVVYDQSENKMHAAKAVMALTMS
jgi:N-acetylornithine carbamoyltransferase